MWERIRCMIIKEFIQVLRDPKIRTMVLMVPIIQTLVFGYAVTTDVKNVAMGVYDEDRTPLSRELVAATTSSGYFVHRYDLNNENEMQALLDRGKALVVLHIPYQFEADIRSGETTNLQVIIDGTDANISNVAQSYLGSIILQFSQRWQPHKEQGIILESRTWFNENLESRNFFVPGILAILISLLTLTLTSMAIVREKENGTMEQILVTPITPRELILGKSVPYILIGVVDVILILLVSTFWFEVPIRGSLLLLSVATGFYLFTTLGIGLFISTISQTQQQAMMSAFLFYFPLVMLSGFIFPVENMPQVIQWVTYLNPLKYFLVIIRGIFLKGIGMEILWLQIYILAIMGACTLYLATQRFKKTMG